MTAEIGGVIFLWALSVLYWAVFYKEYQALMDKWFKNKTKIEEVQDPQECPLAEEY